MKIDISLSKPPDLPAILQLQKECYLDEAAIYNEYDIPPLKQDLQSLREEFKQHIILKTVVENQIIGSVRAFSENGTGHIGRLIVKKEFQNMGIGRLLMESIESICSDCKRFELFTGFKSVKNIYLYNKLGYNEFKKQQINDQLTLLYLEKRIK